MEFLKKNFLLLLIGFLVLMFDVHAASNPYGKYQDLYGVKTVRCTWYAWQQAYDNAGVVLPGWGNAQTWYNSALSDGYAVGQEARANSIAVWSSNDGYGHVAYVVSVDGEYMTINEGGIPITENEGIVVGSKAAIDSSNLIGFIYLDDVPKNTNESSKANDSKKKSSNKELVALTVDIAGFNFDKDIKEYNLEVAYDIGVITIKAEAEDENAVITGTGEKALKVGNNNYKIVVTAEDGTTDEYSINVKRNEQVFNNLTVPVRKEVSKNKHKYIIVVGIALGVVLFSGIGIVISKKIIKKRKHQ